MTGTADSEVLEFREIQPAAAHRRRVIGGYPQSAKLDLADTAALCSMNHGAAGSCPDGRSLDVEGVACRVGPGFGRTRGGEAGRRDGPAARVVDRVAAVAAKGAGELGGEFLELGRSRVALVATLERVQSAFARRLVELDEQGGEVRRESDGLGEDRASALRRAAGRLGGPADQIAAPIGRQASVCG